MLVVYIGVVHFLETSFYENLSLAIRLFCSTLYWHRNHAYPKTKLEMRGKRKEEPLVKSFFSGFFMSISNPLTILFWLGIYGSVLAKTAATYETSQLILYSSAIFIGLLIWDFTMAGISSNFRKYLTPQLLIGISLLSGISLIGFGIYFGYQAFTVLFG